MSKWKATLEKQSGDVINEFNFELNFLRWGDEPLCLEIEEILNDEGMSHIRYFHKESTCPRYCLKDSLLKFNKEELADLFCQLIYGEEV